MCLFLHLIRPFELCFPSYFWLFTCTLSCFSARLMQSCLVLSLVPKPSICTFLFLLKTFGLIDFFFLRQKWMPHRQSLINQVSFTLSSGEFHWNRNLRPARWFSFEFITLLIACQLLLQWCRSHYQAYWQQTEPWKWKAAAEKDSAGPQSNFETVQINLLRFNVDKSSWNDDYYFYSFLKNTSLSVWSMACMIKYFLHNYYTLGL